MDAGTAGVLGAIVGGILGAGGAYGGALVTTKQQKMARLDQLTAEVSGVVRRYADRWSTPGWEFYSRCIEIERHSEATDKQKSAAQALKVAEPGEGADKLRQLADNLAAS